MRGTSAGALGLVVEALLVLHQGMEEVVRRANFLEVLRCDAARAAAWLSDWRRHLGQRVVCLLYPLGTERPRSPDLVLDAGDDTRSLTIIRINLSTAECPVSASLSRLNASDDFFFNLGEQSALRTVGSVGAPFVVRWETATSAEAQHLWCWRLHKREELMRREGVGQGQEGKRVRHEFRGL